VLTKLVDELRDVVDEEHSFLARSRGALAKLKRAFC
jgi:hypothetical protein